MRDIYRSSRVAFRQCKYYLRDERDSIGDMSVWILEQQPAGIFYAKELNASNKQGQQLGNVFMFDSNNVTLETNDLVPGLTRGCIVYYLNHAWMVDSVQQRQIIAGTQFQAEPKVTTYISIRR